MARTPPDDSALKDFLEVIKFSDSATGKEKSKISLRNEATKDVVTVYAQIGTGAKAIPFFKKVAPKRWAEMAFKLAKLYSNTGKVKDANDLYRRLIRLLIRIEGRSRILQSLLSFR